MKFDDSFDVPASLGVAWDALTDIERVYPCLPGAELKEVKENEFHGVVTLRLGPITASYQGTARFESLDSENGTLVIRAEGRDRHGQGTARARIQARLLTQGGDSTRVEMSNEVEITGKAAQFGRGILPDVSKEILGQFAANLREMVSAPGPAGAAGNGSPVLVEGAASREGARGGRLPPESASIDVLTLARSVTARRLRERPLSSALLLVLPMLLVAAIVLILVIAL